MMIKMDKEQLDTFYVLGIAVRTANTPGRATKDIPALWGRFLCENVAAAIEGRLADDVYCVYTEYEGDYTMPYTTLIGCRVEAGTEVPAGMQLLEVEGGQFLKHTASGDLMKGLIFEAWTNIWNATLPRAYRSDFEVYDAAPSAGGLATVSIYLSAKL